MTIDLVQLTGPGPLALVAIFVSMKESSAVRIFTQHKSNQSQSRWSILRRNKPKPGGGKFKMDAVSVQTLVGL